MSGSIQLDAVNRQARAVTFNGQLDVTDPQVIEGMAIADILRGAGLLKEGCYIEAVRQMRGLLSKKTHVVTSMDPEVMKLERQKLDLRRQQANATIEAQKAKMKRVAVEQEHGAKWLRVFKECALHLLRTEDFMAIRDMANEMCPKP